MIITTTDGIDGKKVIQYFMPINATVVIGTSFISDAVASISDFSGGTDPAYTRHMDSMYMRIIKQLQDKAIGLRADALVGLKIEYNQISGKGMQMFMANGYATPVKLLDEHQHKEYLKHIEVADNNKFKEHVSDNKEIGVASKLGNICSICGYAELTGFDKACPKCKRKFI